MLTHIFMSKYCVGSPHDLTAEIVDRDEVHLRWTLPQDKQLTSGYQVYTCRRLWLRTIFANCSDGSCNCSVVENTTHSINLTGLDPDGEYTFFVDSLAPSGNFASLPSEDLAHITLSGKHASVLHACYVIH